MTTYNHAFTLAFAFPKSAYENWEDALKNEKEFIIGALISRVNVLLTNNDEFLEALEGFDTFEE